MHPYKTQPPRARWKQAVSEKHPLSISDWYVRKFPIDNGPVATAGSCFAQHIGRVLRQSGHNFIDVEPSPSWLAEKDATAFGYGMYSARFGNVYSPRQLLQLILRSGGDISFEEPAWQAGTGFVDPFRPSIEPPLESERQVGVAREFHLRNVALMFRSAKTLVFTLGLTEAWLNRATGAAYPICPGVAGGSFDPAKHQFVNFDYPAVVDDLEAFIAEYRKIRPDAQVIFTVSPVPLVATATNQNVVVATSYSKSVLRAAAGYLAGKYAYVDYFPSYEIIASTPMKSMFFEPDMRTVHVQGVAHVMAQFFKEHRIKAPQPAAPPVPVTSLSDHDVKCDEMLLDMQASTNQ